MNRYSPPSSSFFFFFFLFLSAHLPSSNGQQVSTQCTNLLLRSFTPCLNFFTGSSNGGGGSPSSECCKSLGILIGSSTQCACLVLTGQVPLSVPFNRTLAISLTRFCKDTSVPLQCSAAVGSPIPGPGPISYSPSLPPLPPQTTTPPAGVVYSPPPSDIPSPPSPAAITFPSPPATTSPPSTPNSNTPTPANQGSSQGLQPLILPDSALKISAIHSSFVVMSMLAIIYLV